MLHHTVCEEFVVDIVVPVFTFVGMDGEVDYFFDPVFLGKGDDFLDGIGITAAVEFFIQTAVKFGAVDNHLDRFGKIQKTEPLPDIKKDIVRRQLVHPGLGEVNKIALPEGTDDLAAYIPAAADYQDIFSFLFHNLMLLDVKVFICTNKKRTISPHRTKKP
jgi:hypothetical protein